MCDKLDKLFRSCVCVSCSSLSRSLARSVALSLCIYITKQPLPLSQCAAVDACAVACGCFGFGEPRSRRAHALNLISHTPPPPSKYTRAVDASPGLRHNRPPTTQRKVIYRPYATKHKIASDSSRSHKDDDGGDETGWNVATARTRSPATPGPPTSSSRRRSRKLVFSLLRVSLPCKQQQQRCGKLKRARACVVWMFVFVYAGPEMPELSLSRHLHRIQL